MENCIMNEDLSTGYSIITNLCINNLIATLVISRLAHLAIYLPFEKELSRCAYFLQRRNMPFKGIAHQKSPWERLVMPFIFVFCRYLLETINLLSSYMICYRSILSITAAVLMRDSRVWKQNERMCVVSFLPLIPLINTWDLLLRTRV